MLNKNIIKSFAIILIVVSIAGIFTYYSEFISKYYSFSLILSDSTKLTKFGIPMLLLLLLVIFNIIIIFTIDRKPKIAGILGILNPILSFFCLPVLWLIIAILTAIDGIKLIKES